jgi:hypothetical protein
MHANSSKAGTLLPIYLLWFLSLGLQQLPELSYIIAWSGSFAIFYLTLHSAHFFNPALPRRYQLLRPIVTVQFIFAGFMCCSSIFYFLDHHDYYFFNQIDDQTDPPDSQIYRIAKCQRLYLLAHCALVTGILLASKPSRKCTYLLTVSTDRLLIGFSLISYVSAFLLALFPGTLQFALLFSNLSLFSGSLLFVRSIQQKQFIKGIPGACILILSLSTHLFTGYKEPIVVHLILLVSLTYSAYPKTTKILFIPLILVFFIFLPSFTKNIRKLAWDERRQLSGIHQTTYLSLLNQSSDELDENNWEFLTNRLSEIGMFVQFVKKVPEERPYYGWEILQNAIQALIPRALWPSKPNTEKLAMKRVYELGVANRASNVSAKCRPIVDGYLSAGAIGVFTTIFLYGLLAQSICNTAERWFGGYTVGCVAVFNGLFQQLWRGNNFEFILNNIFYGMLLMTILFYLLRIGRILVPKPLKNETPPDDRSH